MPIYEYECKDCKHQFEVLTTQAQQTENVKCPKCKSTDVVKNMSASSIRIGSSAPSSLGSASSGCSSTSGFS